MERINSITLTFDFDRILKGYVTDEEGLIAGTVKETMSKEKKVLEWYTEKYPTDEFGKKINETITWLGLLNSMRDHKEVYETIGVSDSIVRERCFAKLASLMFVPYDVIYNLWLSY